MWILIRLRVNDVVDVCACVDKGVSLCLSWRSSVSEQRSYQSHLYKHKRRLTLKLSARSAAISEAQQGK